MNPPIRILHLITSLNTGGAEMALARLLSTMDQQVFDAHVVCMIPVGPVGERIESLGIPVTSLDMLPGRPTLRGFRQLLDLIRQFQPDILQTWLYHADLLGLLAARLTETQTILWNIRSANMDFGQYETLSSLVIRTCAFLSGWPQGVVINSQAGKKAHIRLGYHPKKWIFIPNGIDTVQFQADNTKRNCLRQEWGVAEDETLFGLVGRFHPIKDHPTFLKAAAMVQEQRSRVRFVCVGDGSDARTSELKGLATQLGLSNVIWAGARTDMPNVYNALDILVSSSMAEGFPNAIAEAMSCERPCIVTDVGDSAFLVAETGLSVSPRSPGALAGAFLKMLELPAAERARCGKDARQRVVENFGLKEMADKYATLYLNLTKSEQ